MFGNLVLGPAPVVDLDAPSVILNLVDTEIGLLRDGMQRLDARAAQQKFGARLLSVTSPVNHGEQVLRGDRLLQVLRRIDEGTALVVTRVPGGGSAICTAYVGSSAADCVRNIWLSAS